MRIALVGLALLGLAGCSWDLDWDNGWFSDSWDTGWNMEGGDGVLWASTRGVVLDEDGDEGVAGMSGTTCRVFQDGWVGEDYDFPGEDDEVVDSDDGGDIVLIKTGDRLRLFNPNAFWDDGFDNVPVNGALAGTLLDDGVAAVRRDSTGCAVQWTGDSPAVQSLSPSVCDTLTDMTADPTVGTVWITSDAGLTVVNPGSIAAVAPEWDLVVWDDAADALYVAHAGGDTVAALEADGTTRWTVQISGVVVDVQDMGSRASAAVMVGLEDGRGELVVIDGRTGETETGQETPRAAQSIAVSGNGRKIAFIERDQVIFEDIR